MGQCSTNLKIGMENKELTNINDVAYQKLIDNITALWGEAKSKAVNAVNTELLEANWQTGKYNGRIPNPP